MAALDSGFPVLAFIGTSHSDDFLDHKRGGSRPVPPTENPLHRVQRQAANERRSG